jgi:hypothetical protein
MTRGPAVRSTSSPTGSCSTGPLQETIHQVEHAHDVVEKPDQDFKQLAGGSATTRATSSSPV